jgi:hypothetical protein
MSSCVFQFKKCPYVSLKLNNKKGKFHSAVNQSLKILSRVSVVKLNYRSHEMPPEMYFLIAVLTLLLIAFFILIAWLVIVAY